MKLYIKVEDGQIIGNPVVEGNLIAAFKKVPDNYKPFIRVQKPLPSVLGVYETLAQDYANYEFDEDLQAWKDVWPKRDMTDAEKAEKQQAVKDEWANSPDRDNFSTWTFDEEKCEYVAPIAKPTDGIYFWDGSANNWIKVIPE